MSLYVMEAYTQSEGVRGYGENVCMAAELKIDLGKKKKTEAKTTKDYRCSNARLAISWTKHLKKPTKVKLSPDDGVKWKISWWFIQ